jgi:FixJ family two-component response regulator
MTAPDGVVFVVDDDSAFRESLKNLLRSIGLRVETFTSAHDFLDGKHANVPGCVVLDVRMPGLSGLDLQKRMAEGDLGMPIIFVTGHGDIPMSVQAMKAGAVEFLTKPFRDQDLLDAVQRALERDRAHRQHRAAIEGIRNRFDALTPREREVMGRVVAGLLNKQIARALGTSEATVKIQRQHVMQKMDAGSLADLVRMADRLGIVIPKS